MPRVSFGNPASPARIIALSISHLLSQTTYTIMADLDNHLNVADDEGNFEELFDSYILYSALYSPGPQSAQTAGASPTTFQSRFDIAERPPALVIPAVQPEPEPQPPSPPQSELGDVHNLVAPELPVAFITPQIQSPSPPPSEFGDVHDSLNPTFTELFDLMEQEILTRTANSKSALCCLLIVV